MTPGSQGFGLRVSIPTSEIGAGVLSTCHGLTKMSSAARVRACFWAGVGGFFFLGEPAPLNEGGIDYFFPGPPGDSAGCLFQESASIQCECGCWASRLTAFQAIV